MYVKWIPITGVKLDMPQLQLTVSGASLTIGWKSTFGQGANLSIHFDGAVAGMIVLDESTLFGIPDLGMPLPSEFDEGGDTGESCFAWRESDSARKVRYGQYGADHYKRLDSYYLYGGNILVLADIYDCVPVINVVPT
jgi:hypothetical protein